MNDKLLSDTNLEEELAKKLDSIAARVNADPYFVSELEQNLMEKHQPKKNWSLTLNQFSRTLGWVALIIVSGLFLNWTFKALVPKPQPAVNIISTPTFFEPSIVTHTITPDVLNNSYDWHGTKLNLIQPMPHSPIEAKVYSKKFTEASPEHVLALAQQFGINGELEQVPSEFPGKMNYIVNGIGKQKLEVRTDYYFVYHSNFEELYLDNLSDEQARIIADNFLKRHGFNFEYRFERAPEMQGQQFYIIPLLLDDRTVHFDFLNPWRYEIVLDNTGENIIFSGYFIEFEELGNFGIITVEEAFQKIIAINAQTGLMQTFYGYGGGGGGSSFLQINPSGTPAVFPSPTPPTIIETPIIEYDPAFTPPTATIETIDLAYHLRYPPYVLADPAAGIQYLQPVWRFYGHYSNGDEFEILIQALEEEFLLPELAPYTPPG